MKQIALVEDEVLLRRELGSLLRKAGYQVRELTDFASAAEELLAAPPDLVLLDLNLPGASGFQICRALKQKSGIAVLVLTSRDQLGDELRVLELGADEYLTKPCRKERLLARVANVMKRYEGRANLLEGDGFLLDRQSYTLYCNNTSAVLPQNPGKILEALMMGGGAVVSREALAMAVWGTTEFVDENALQVNLNRLKKALRQHGVPQHIITVRGAGYRLSGGENP